MIQALTAKEIIDAYNDGCGIDYNPNHIVQMLNDLINTVFVTEGKDKRKIGQAAGSVVA